MNLGAHMSTAGGIHTAFERAEAATCSVIQLFTKSERQWKAKPLTDEILEKWRDAKARSTARPLLVHDSYLINLASPDDRLWTTSKQAFAEELERCKALEIPYLVTHPGAHTGSGVTAGLQREATALNEIFEDGAGGDTVVLLETTAGQGTVLGGTVEELAQLIEMLRYPERVGICVDTCHLFAAGYDLRSEEGYTAAVDRFAALLGLERVRAFHLNDSQGELGSNRDRHAGIGEGQIGTAAFGRLVNDPRFRAIPMVLETPKGPDGAEDRRNLALLRSLRVA